MFGKLESNRESVLKAFNKTDKDVKNDLNHLNEWLKKQPHLPKVNEVKLEFILARNKFNLEKTKRTIDIWYSLKHQIPEIFSNWDISTPQLQTALDTHVWILLPKLTPNLERVIVSKLLDTDPEKFNHWESHKLSLMLSELISETGKYYCVSNQVIYDMKGFQMSHIVKYTVSAVQKLIACRKGAADRHSAIHIVNPVSNANALFSLIKPFLKQKMIERLYIHQDYSSLYEYIPKEILPKDYGGEELSVAELWGEWRKEIENRKEWFINKAQEKSDESKRIDDVVYDTSSSIDGSFRQLDID